MIEVARNFSMLASRVSGSKRGSATWVMPARAHISISPWQPVKPNKGTACSRRSPNSAASACVMLGWPGCVGWSARLP